MIDSSNSLILELYVKKINHSWINFFNPISGNNRSKIGLIQLRSLGSEYEDPLSLGEQGNELLDILKCELNNERILRDDTTCKVNIHSIKFAWIREDGIEYTFIDEFEVLPNVRDSARIKVEYYID